MKGIFATLLAILVFFLGISSIGGVIEGAVTSNGTMITYAIIAGILSLIIWKMAKRKTPKSNTSKEDPVIDTLKMRYARGEITKAEYEEKKKDLEDIT